MSGASDADACVRRSLAAVCPQTLPWNADCTTPRLLDQIASEYPALILEFGLSSLLTVLSVMCYTRLCGSEL